jgi:calreticulin
MLSVVALLLGLTSAKVYFKDGFSSDPFANNRWVQSSWKQDSGEAGTLEFSGGLWGAGERGGIRTTEDAKFYAFTAKVDEEFDNADAETLVFAFSVKHEQKMDCGGGYAKLLPPGIDTAQFNGDTDYSIMFGPDICGYSTKKVQAIFNYNGENLARNSDVKCPDDEYTHSYVLIVNKDSTYEIRVDGEEKAKGAMKDDWSFEKAKEIKDPDQSKPEDWVDAEKIDDPEDVKPDNWDDEPASIPDPDATKPDDWDDEEDGEWQAPSIDNPEYKGEWRAKRIDNPDYKGKWEHPMIANPDYVEAENVYQRGPIGYIGVEVWQVKAGTVFSDFILTDSVAEAEAFLEEQKTNADDEKAAKEAYDEAKKAEEAEEEDGEEDATLEDEEEDKDEL